MNFGSIVRCARRGASDQYPENTCLSYDFRFLTAAIATECQLTGLALWPWDPDEPDDIHQMLTFGVQGIMTNRPDAFNMVLHDLTF